MTSIAFPFLRLGDDAVVASSWMVSVEGRANDVLNGQLEHWDYSASLDLGRTITVNFDDAARQLEIDACDLQIIAFVTIGTGGGRLPRFQEIIWRQSLSDGQSQTKIQFAIDSVRLSQKLTLTTEIILANSPRIRSTLAPQHPATRLWSDEITTNIESSNTRFPIEVVSFRRLLREQAPDALWFLDWPFGDLTREFSSAVRLYINADASEFVNRVREPDSVTLQLLTASVITQMARATIRDENFSLNMVDEIPGTIGAIVAYWISNAFPNQSLGTVKSRAELDPAGFEAALSSITSSQMEK